MSGRDDTCWLDVTVTRTREMAIEVRVGERSAWLPRSLVYDSEDDLVDGTITSIEIGQWLAEEKDLV